MLDFIVSLKGEIEQAIVQRIDKRVGEAFLKMIGIKLGFPNTGRKRQTTH